MASPIMIKIVNRNPKRPIKNLPSTIEVNENTTAQDVKIAVAKAGRWDPERMGLFGPETKKILKDRKQLVLTHPEISAGREIVVKDLGPQMSWITVFVLEYLGPILIHPFYILIRPYIYTNPGPLSSSQYLSMAMIVAHFVKREYETLYVHRFSLSTMPASNIWWNCGWYWLGAGLNIAPWIYSPSSYTAKSSPLITYVNILGVVLYVYGEVSNYITHITLSNLRTPGGTERGIPKGYGFSIVTCPNYMFELVSWLGMLLVSKSFGTAFFIGLAGWKMNQWAIKKEKAYRTEFPETYKKKRNQIVPGVGGLIKALTG